MLLYRRIRYGYAFRRIRLTQGKYAIVDCDDYARLSTYKWHARRSVHMFYAARTVARRAAQMHRKIIDVPDNLCVDHINHNGLDNRKANLRAVTVAQNAKNRRKCKGFVSSQYKGVYWNKSKNRWRAQIWVGLKRIYLGTFKDEIAAARAYDKAAKKYYGEYAVLNLERS